jgi:hypothetical protein
MESQYGEAVNMKKSIILICIISIIFFQLFYDNKEYTHKANINTQLYTIVEFYKYINIISSAVPRETIIDKQRNTVIETLNYSIKKYKSNYSTIVFTPYHDGDTHIGKFTFTFNPKTLSLIPLIGENINTRKTFYCDINIYQINNILVNQLPICLYNDNISFSYDFNNKVKEIILVSTINSLIYNNIKVPYNIPDKINILSSLSKFNIHPYSGNIINDISLTKFDDYRIYKKNNYLLDKISNTNYIKDYNYKNPIVNFEIKVNLINNDKFEVCTLEYYQPWYYLISDIMYGTIKNCEIIKAKKDG